MQNTPHIRNRQDRHLCLNQIGKQKIFSSLLRGTQATIFYKKLLLTFRKNDMVLFKIIR